MSQRLAATRDTDVSLLTLFLPTLTDMSTAVFRTLHRNSSSLQIPLCNARISLVKIVSHGQL